MSHVKTSVNHLVNTLLRNRPTSIRRHREPARPELHSSRFQERKRECCFPKQTSEGKPVQLQEHKCQSQSNKQTKPHWAKSYDLGSSGCLELAMAGRR